MKVVQTDKLAEFLKRQQVGRLWVYWLIIKMKKKRSSTSVVYVLLPSLNSLGP